MLRSNKKNKLAEFDSPVPKKTFKKCHNIHSLEARKNYSENVNNLLSTGSLVIIQGPTGCGKTHCAREVSIIRRLNLHILQINEEIDSKWITEECLILLEDFDLANPDLIACLLTLLEKQDHMLQNGEKIVVNSECRILATVNSITKRMDNKNLLNDYPLKLEIKPLSFQNLCDICDAQFLHLTNIKEKILNVFRNVQEKILNLCPLERQLTIRLIFKT